MIVPNRVNACHDALHRAELSILRRLRLHLNAGGRLADLDDASPPVRIGDVENWELFWTSICHGVTAAQVAVVDVHEVAS